MNAIRNYNDKNIGCDLLESLAILELKRWGALRGQE